jgi:Ca2+-binding RTX toxin-like protein
MRRLLLAAVVLAVALVAPTGASAATARISGETIQDDSCRYLPQECELAVLEYGAAPGERNDVTFQFESGSPSFSTVVRDGGAVIEPGGGCERLDEHAVRCRPGTPLDEIVVRAGDGDDSVVASGRSTLHGGSGSDRLALTGASLGHLDGGGGRDTLLGGDGVDYLTDGDTPGAADADVLDGGGEVDTLSYGDRRRGMRVDLSGAGGSGEPGEDDRVSNIEATWTGSGADVLIGTERADFLDGNAGDDRLVGRSGRDVLEGGSGGDGLSAGPGNDSLLGGRGDDDLLGGRGRDRFAGGSGRDTLLARDGERDRGSGGPGRDRALVDLGLDELRGVERLLGGL